MSGQNELTSYTYDVFGNLRSVTLPDNTLIQYVVDSAGRRIGKKVGGVLKKTWLYRSGLQIAAEVDDNGVMSRFGYSGGRNVPDFMIRNSVPYRIITDHLGSVRLVVNANTGAVVQRMDYSVFGYVTNDWVADGQTWRVPFGFAGGLYDPDTKLVRFGARDYDAEVGRWTAKDPIRFGGGDANLYGYVMTDPVNWTDPRGFYPLGGFPAENANNPAPPVALSIGFGGNLGAGVVSPVLEGGLGYIFDVSRSGWFRTFAMGPGVMPGVSAGFGIQVCLSWVPGAMWGDGASIGGNTPLCGVDVIATPQLKPHGFCGSVGYPGASGGWDGHILWTDTQRFGD